MKLSNLKKLMGIALVMGVFMVNAEARETKNVIKAEKLKLESKWDKTFPQSDKVSHKKVTFVNHFGITLAADMYTPKSSSLKGEDGKLPAIAVCGPFGAVKEQCSGLYAQTMAEKGYVTIAFDPSFCGESAGLPRYMNSPDINTEDFQAAVDFLSVQENVAPERIGICGWGGFAVNTAGIDTRIKATAAITMYDMSQNTVYGYFDLNDEEARYKNRVALNAQRTADYKAASYAMPGGLPPAVPEDTPQFLKDYVAYYKTERGYHPRSLNSNTGWALQANASLMNTKLLAFADEIRSPVMIVHGENAHSRYMGEGAYKKLISGKYASNKELVIVPGASHCDLYDGGDGNFIPWNKLEEFFGKNLK
ncbi:Hydrolase of the alpha/beta superfamily [Treponema sp. JC4]|uniref:alpha/beta hydrolase n=1 Tax=Treponema sp. JC4 TaxID=1124982 RepID=UPI00025B0E57|nr:alpha/beta hydrolase [Treponema sp. JC4]EID84369.1 Hydrolase of the alpha/beta superfamily [Treponema sp. JC4]